MSSATRWICTCALLFATFAAQAGEKSWVTSDSLYRRTCPSTTCGIVGKFFFRQAVEVEEITSGWARVTKYYDASCVNGRSEYVDSGDARCIESNGIRDGQFAEWVSVKYLSESQPADPGAGAVGIAALISDSDDFRKHKDAFIAASQTLLSQGRCSEQDFKEMGGWSKSSNHPNQPIYFTYCGGMAKANRIYLDASSGRIFR